MFLLSVLLSAITFAPAMPAAHTVTGAREGEIQATWASPDATCSPGAICASAKFTTQGCYFNNLYVKGVKGGTPLTIDVTETGSGNPVYIYWVNTLSTSLSITGVPHAHYYCPSS
jgi:hypothetical protein